MTPYQNLCSEVDSLIRTEGRYTENGYELNYSDLQENDQQTIVAAFIDDDDRDLFSVYENEKYDDIVSSLLSMLKKDTRDSEEDFVQCLKTRLREYYANRAQELIDERCADIESNEQLERGMMRIIDRNTGESRVVRI